MPLVGSEREAADQRSRERIAAKRLHKQAAAERRKLQATQGMATRSQHNGPLQSAPNQPVTTRTRHDPYLDWLDRPKNLSGRARANASGLVRVRNAGGSERQWVELSDVQGLFQRGWTLD